MWCRKAGTADGPRCEWRSTRWWLGGLSKGLAALTLAYLPLWWFQSNYRVYYDMIEGPNCLPYSVFLLDLNDRSVERGDYIAFETQQMEPFYPNGTTAIKILAGIPGDHVTVDEGGVTVNSKRWGGVPHVREGGVLWQRGRRLLEYFRDELVPAEHYWMLASDAHSYDSRYWGYIHQHQVIGRATPLW